MIWEILEIFLAHYKDPVILEGLPSCNFSKFPLVRDISDDICSRLLPRNRVKFD